MFSTQRHRKFRHEEVLRAIGHHLDAQRLACTLLLETPEGFLIKATPLPDEGVAPARPVERTFLLTNWDVLDLIEAAHRRRRTGAERQPAEASGVRR